MQEVNKKIIQQVDIHNATNQDRQNDKDKIMIIQQVNIYIMQQVDIHNATSRYP